MFSFFRVSFSGSKYFTGSDSILSQQTETVVTLYDWKYFVNNVFEYSIPVFEWTNMLSPVLSILTQMKRVGKTR